MSSAAPALPDLKVLAELIRVAARAELLPRFARGQAQAKADGSLVTEADTAMQARLTAALATGWPEIPLLGEEMTAADQQDLLADSGDTGLWLLDPVDGTSNFAAGIPFYSVSLALVRGGQAVLGLVYDPQRDECFSARRDPKGQAVDPQLNGKPLVAPPAPTDLGQCLAVVDFKRLAPDMARRLVTQMPYASQRSFGSGALDFCWIAAGRGQVYLHGKQKAWDYAAGALVLEAAGGRGSTLEGEALDCASLAPCSAVAAQSEDLFEAWQAWLMKAA